MNAKILIIEGTSGVGKSFMADALLQKYMSKTKKMRSVLYLTQAHTYGPLVVDEDQQTLTREINKKYLDEVYKVLQWFTYSVANEHKVKCYCLIDTLHLTQCFRPGIIKWDDISAYDTKLKRMECKLIFIKAKAATIWARGIVPRMNEQFMLVYAKKFGSTAEQIHQYFVNEQEDLEELVTNCHLEKICLDAEDDFRQNVDRAYQFWLQ